MIIYKRENSLSNVLNDRKHKRLGGVIVGFIVLLVLGLIFAGFIFISIKHKAKIVNIRHRNKLERRTIE